VAKNPAKARKAKGRALQNWVRDRLLDMFKTDFKDINMTEEDIKSQTMGMKGEDIILTPHARGYIPFSFECKNVEKLSIWDSIEQCQINAVNKEGKLKGFPAVIFKKNRKTPHVAISWEVFQYLLECKITASN
jgi:hypothetical protein